MNLSKFFLASVALVATAAAIAGVRLSSGGADNWTFLDGAEFPGAGGSLVAEASQGAWRLRYDFARGGQYVAAVYHGEIHSGSALSLKVDNQAPIKLNYRVADADGRYFQGQPRDLAAGGNFVEFSLAGPWSDVWGGKDNAAQPQFPLKEFSLMVLRGSEGNSLLFRDLDLITEQVPESAFAVAARTVEFGGWTVSLDAVPQFAGAMLGMKFVRGENAQPLHIQAAMAANGRAAKVRYAVTPETAVAEYGYRLPFADGKGNLRNRYVVDVTMQAADGAELTVPIVFAGSRSRDWMAPVKSLDTENIFGSSTHFGFGIDAQGPFAAWHNYEQLLDKLADIGMKFIRDDIGWDSGEEGIRVRPYDIAWMRAAKARGIEPICLMHLDANESMEDYLARVEATVRDTRDFVTVYELGNEPNNFGGWIGKFGGQWNGRTAENEVAPWVVEHLRYTNAGAERIRALYPDAVIIGLGSPAPANFRAMSLGLSDAVDGVVEHPYSFALPPELVPFGLGLSPRDGVDVGDAGHTFRGLIESYKKHGVNTGKERSIWLTEFGFTTYWQDGTNEGMLYLGYTEEAQAAYLLRRFIEAAGLGVAAALQYDLLDDYGSQWNLTEANFGILYADYSPKPSYHAIGRMNALLDSARPDASCRVAVTAAPLHRGATRELLTRWDEADMVAEQGVRTYAFVSEKFPDERTLAVWNAAPFNGEANNRMATLEIEGWGEFSQMPVAFDPVTGESFDIPFEVVDGKLILKNLSLRNNPLLIKFFR